MRKINFFQVLKVAALNVWLDSEYLRRPPKKLPPSCVTENKKPLEGTLFH